MHNNKKKVLITGSTGMVGNIVLEHCLKSNEINEVVELVRKPTGLTHQIYSEVIVSDFLNYDKYVQYFNNVDIIFYCLGVYTGAVPPDEFRKINFDYPFNLAKAIYLHSPQATFCLLSGQGADRSEKSSMQFARDKGAIENALSALQFKSFYTFRPGYIYPTKKRVEPNMFYKITRLLYPLLKLLGNNLSITDKQLANTMFRVGLNGHTTEILENKDMRLFN